MSEQLAKRLSIALFFLNALKDLPENDFHHLCLQSLQIDFLDLPLLKNELLNKELAISYYSQKHKDKDMDHQALKRWKITEEGERIFNNLPLHLTEGSKNFLTHIVSDYRNKQENPYTFEASVQPSAFGAYSIKLKQFEKNICIFSLQFLIPEQIIAEELATAWLAKNNLEYKHQMIQDIQKKCLELEPNRNRYDKTLESFNHDP